jgi:hypothetical protein
MKVPRNKYFSVLGGIVFGFILVLIGFRLNFTEGKYADLCGEYLGMQVVLFYIVYQNG